MKRFFLTIILLSAGLQLQAQTFFADWFRGPTRKELSAEYLCLENAALSPRLMNVLPGEGGYPAAIEITLPEAMIAIPFRAGEAEVVAVVPFAGHDGRCGPRSVRFRRFPAFGQQAADVGFLKRHDDFAVTGAAEDGDRRTVDHRVNIDEVVHVC